MLCVRSKCQWLTNVTLNKRSLPAAAAAIKCQIAIEPPLPMKCG